MAKAESLEHQSLGGRGLDQGHESVTMKFGGMKNFVGQQRSNKSAVVGVYGETLADVELFKQAVAQGCDIVIVDQNLSLPGAEVKGTTLICEIFAAGYTGLACVRSANCTNADQTDYLCSGAHCAIDKELRFDRW